MSLSMLGSNLPLVKRTNRSLVLRILLHHGPISRSEIGEMTRLTTATIGNVISELQDNGLVVELGAEPPADQTRPGRRRVLVDLNPTGLYVLGVRLGVRVIRIGVGDLRGRVLAKTMVPVGENHSPEQIFDVVHRQAIQLLDQAAIPMQRVCGVGVGSVGLVDSDTGEIIDLPQHGWRRVPARQLLGDRFQLPVVVDDSRRAMATAEAWLGRGRGSSSVMLVHVGTTVGAAVVFRGDVLPGANHAAGRLGSLIVTHGEGSSAAEDTLDGVASGAAIVGAAVRAALEGRSPGLTAMAHGDPEHISVDHVFAAAEQGDGVAHAIVDRAARLLGVGVAHYISLFDPEILILAGPVANRGGAQYRRRVAAVANERSWRPEGRAVEFILSSFGDDIELVGPFSLALQRFVYSGGLSLPKGSADEFQVQLPARP